MQSLGNTGDFVTACMFKNPYIHTANAIKDFDDVFINLNQAPQNFVRMLKKVIRVFQTFSAKYFIHQKCR